MRVLLAFEESQTCLVEFLSRGHDAWSCDLLETSGPRPDRHLHRDALPVLRQSWDLVIAFPPCTHLSRSGARWWPEKIADGRQQAAISVFMAAVNANAPRVAVENPRGIMSRRYRQPDQVIQPWEFGHGEVKATCLWLKGLPPLMPTDLHWGREARVHRLPPSPDRSRLRSKTYQGIAAAMGDQWG